MWSMMLRSWILRPTLLSSCVKIPPRLLKRVFGLVDRMVASKQVAPLYAAFTILSKIGDELTIARHVEAGYDYWKNNYGLGRVVGSLRPIVWQTEYRNKFASLIRHSRNLGAQEVLDFLYFVGTDRRVYQSVRKFLFAPNNSFANRITHSKFLVVWAVLQGDLLSEEAKDVLRTIHKAASADPYYKAQLRVATTPPKHGSSRKDASKPIRGGVVGRTWSSRAAPSVRDRSSRQF